MPIFCVVNCALTNIAMMVEENVMSSFLKPKPLRLRKRPSRPLLPTPLQQVQPKSHLLPRNSPKLPRNPFRRSEGGKRKLEDAEDEDSLLWHHIHRPLDPPLVAEPKSLLSSVVPSMLDECALSAFSETVLETRAKPSPPTSLLLPVDWSLKTRVRFTSPAPFPSRGNFRTFEEVNGTIGFVRCLHPGGEAADKCSDLHSSHGAKFFQQSLVWTHPSLPWLTLFPRTHKHNGHPALSASAQEILHSKWCDSFRSLYQLVRLYQCPYFYMCAPTFTVLFRCAGAASIPVLHALISPTTRGLRNALREEGITFSMPLCTDSDSPSCDTPDEEAAPDDNEEEDENLAEDDASWLESLGLSQDAFPSLHKKKHRRDFSQRVDHRPQSLVCVEDSETQALVNLLLNSSLCADKIGLMAGVPPTLLSPCAFLGGTLQSLQMRVGKVKQGDLELDSVELSGPVLPSALHSLCSLLSSTQPEYSATLTSLPPTEAFSQVQLHSPLIPCIFAQNNLTDCGLPPPFVQQMCCPSASGGPLRTLRMEGGLYTSNS